MGVSWNPCIFLIFSALLIVVIESLKDVRVTVPEAVRMRETITLQCAFDLEGEPLYTVKWYKGSKELFRFIPKELPNSKVFAMPGIEVDLSKSTRNELVLRNVQPEVTGRYKCEVSSDAPNFYTKMDSGYMYVVDAPIDDPSLTIDKNLVDIGDFVSVNCTTLPSFPSTNVSWYLNGIKVAPSSMQKLEVTPELSTSNRKYFITISGMELQITESTFQNGKAVLSCVAKLFNLYRGERKETIEEAKPRPRPSSVLGPRNDSSVSQRLKISNVGFILTFILLHVHR
ncbi:uncharacterized protein LOC109538124 [Dendroctonus ponderosae]|uniref:Ig-like domain-containing protein n=1 Tax=Dendroctonus ponderosae TaxID=77166 RepID=A0AAR5PIA0_DENPD|nr:uncharacterized protein LOC109538124 [Dendroctonus ponderosae]